MNRLSKLFAGMGTGLMNNSFFRAKIRLAILYTVIFGSLILILSGILYHLFASDIHEDMSSIYKDKSVQAKIINYHKIPLRNFIINFDIGILVFIAVVSYFLADITLKPIQENDEAQKRFIANASHELRTPITILKTDMEVYLMDKKFPVFLKPVFNGYLEEVDNMKLIIENMLTLFRFESHQMKINKENFLLTELVIANIERMKSYAKSKSVTIKSDINKDIFFFGDNFFIKQAFRNILKNAIEYSKKKGKVIVKLNKVTDVIKITITDDGIGIPKNILGKIFNRFQRSAQSTHKRKEGVGLGLAIAKQIIELHSGKIKISSIENQGTMVVITLPFKS